MANCDLLFQDFNGNLSITKTKKDNLICSKDNLREKIKKYFEEHHPEYEPKFRIQGSYTLGTMIRTKEDTCDLDNGVYFFPRPEQTGTTLQGWVWDAVEDATGEKPQHRKKCIRVVYKNDYHIDLPVYYKLDKKNDQEQPHLAVKDDEWQKSDPKEFKDWFKRRKDKEGQLVRIVRYLKAWCDNRPKKMPTGLAMTVLAANHIKYNEKDDKCLRDTLKAIRSSLKVKWACVMPTTPGEDLFDKFKGDKDYFFDSIDALIQDADKAIDEETNQLKASKRWRKHLGDYFPEGEDANVDEKLRQLFDIAAILKENKGETSKAGMVVAAGAGVMKNLVHKFYSDEDK